MSNRHLKRKAHYIDEDTWWNEDSDGIQVFQCWVESDEASTFTILWDDLRAAVARKDKPEVKGRKEQ